MTIEHIDEVQKFLNAEAGFLDENSHTAFYQHAVESGITFEKAEAWTKDFQKKLGANPSHKLTQEETVMVYGVVFGWLKEVENTHWKINSPRRDEELSLVLARKYGELPSLYQLVFNKESAKIIVKALEMFCRMAMNDFNAFYDFFMSYQQFYNISDDRLNQIKNLLQKVKELIVTDERFSGIRQTPEESKLAWDILGVIRHRMTCEETPPESGNTFDAWSYLPIPVSEKSIPSIKKVQ